MGTEKRERQKANRALKHQEQVKADARRKLLRQVALGVAAVAALVLFVWVASNFVGNDEGPTTPPATLPVNTSDTTSGTTTPGIATPDVTTADTAGG